MSFIFLTSCSEDPKILGKRELFIAAPADLSISNSSEAFEISKSNLNKNWLQDNFSAKNEQMNLALDCKNLKLLWKKKVGQGVSGSGTLTCNIVMQDEILYLGDAAGNVIAFNTNKQEKLWSTAIAKDEEEVAKIGGLGILKKTSGKHVLVAITAGGRVCIIDMKNGKIIKEKNLKAPIRSAPCIYSDKIIIQSSNNSLFFLDEDLKQSWSCQETPEDVVFLGNSSPACDSNMVVAAYSNGEYKSYAFDSGYEFWFDFMTPSSQDDTVANILHIYSSPVITDDLVITLGHGGALVANKISSGDRVWTKPITGLQTPAVFGKWLVVIDAEGIIYCIDKTNGNIRWKNVVYNKADKEPANVFTKPVIAGDHIIVANNNKALMLFEVKSGLKISELKVGGSAPVSLIVVNKTIYILTSDGAIHAFGC